MPDSLPLTATHTRAHLWSAFADGFDETPPENIGALVQLFGALKQRWPALRTVATLDWSEYETHVKLELPLDVWVEEPNAMRRNPSTLRYWNQSGWNSSSALSRGDIDTWRRAGREFWQVIPAHNSTGVFVVILIAFRQ